MPEFDEEQFDQITENTTETVEDATTDQAGPPESDSDGLPGPSEGDDTGEETGDDSDETFTRTYVEKLRRESARYRERAQQADTLAERLHVALVAATGRLADATDLPFDETHLDDPEVLADAIEALVEKKPHLASRRPTGEIGQGSMPSGSTVNLAGLLRSRAN
ncbi:hypothetical protein [Tomitella fengzijianii]|uniref:hypothetical protein n=1 Tax=Tomitella fengzijianii TaxID=2597660 RepID=UPI0018EECE95|nr:hypothetical protein [Tomitella fengzijianii]